MFGYLKADKPPRAEKVEVSITGWVVGGSLLRYPDRQEEVSKSRSGRLINTRKKVNVGDTIDEVGFIALFPLFFCCISRLAAIFAAGPTYYWYFLLRFEAGPVWNPCSGWWVLTFKFVLGVFVARWTLSTASRISFFIFSG